MTASTLGTLFRNEIRMLVRDTRTILIAVIAPIVIFPVLAFVMTTVESREEARLDTATFEYVVSGDAVASGLPILERALERVAGDSTTRARFERVEADDPDRVRARIADGSLALLVEIRSPADDAEVDVPSFVLTYRGPSDLSRRAESTLRTALDDVREELRDSAFSGAGFPVHRDRVARVERESVASDARVAGAFLGLALTPFLVLLMLSGGSIVAADAISGEKERGTLETLLTSAADRRSIVRAKLLAVVAVGFTVASINVANLVVYAGLGVLDLPTRLAVDLSPAGTVLLALLILPITLLVASALLLLSGFAKSYREYQTWFFPVFLCFLLPALLPVMPGLELRSAAVILPISGVGLAIRDLLVGETDPLFAGLAFLTTALPALGLTRVVERALSNERLISNAELDEADLVGGPALFPRHALAWFLGFWVVFFVNVLWFGEQLGIRGQVIVNLVVIFFGGSMFVVRRYRLPVRETFGLRAPSPLAWIATLIAAPSALLLGIGLSEWMIRWLFPVPEGMMEAMAEAMTADLPLWQLVVFVAVMPAIFEELAFRGLLVRGLRGMKLPTWAVIVAGGAIFGVFHVSLFRIFPTAWLGMNLVAVVLLTRSIWPAVLWHFLNNALAIVPTELGWVDTTGAFPAWTPWVSLVALVGAWGLFWRSADDEGRAAFSRRGSRPRG